MNELHKPIVSFVIPARNEERFIGDCVDSLRLQSLDVPFEIIVVDNGSTDATAAASAKHGARVVFEQREGLAYARQSGLEAACGAYLVYVDADSRLPAGWTRDIISRFERDSRLVAVSTGFTFHDGRAIDNLGILIFRQILAPVMSFALRLRGHAEILIGSAIVVRTDALRRSGGVDPAFQFYGEDTMLSCRIHSQGKVQFLRQPLYQTSARRYQQRGLLSVVYRYFVIFALIRLGQVAIASWLAGRFRDRDRRSSQRPVSLTFATPSATASPYEHGALPNGRSEPLLVANGRENLTSSGLLRSRDDTAGASF